MKTIFTLSLLALALPACMPNQQMMMHHNQLANYEKSSSSIDKNGKITEWQSSSKVSTDKNGNRTAVITSKTTENPKGLFNTRTTKQTREVIEE